MSAKWKKTKNETRKSERAYKQITKWKTMTTRKSPASRCVTKTDEDGHGGACD